MPVKKHKTKHRFDVYFIFEVLSDSDLKILLLSASEFSEFCFHNPLKSAVFEPGDTQLPAVMTELCKG